MFVKKVEIELSSYCNAGCPGCLRTQILKKGNSFPLNHLDERKLYERFENLNLEKTVIFLCGVLGDPLIHPKIMKIIKWFLSKGSQLDISTNASLQSKAFWHELGQLSFNTKRLDIRFAVDGLDDTNFIYRVNTDYQLIKRNMRVYSKAGGSGVWVFIEFDHNSHQKEKVRELAHSLNFDFVVSRNTRNINQWKTVSKNKEKSLKRTHIISHKKNEVHPEIKEYEKMTIQTKDWNSSSINCLFLHEKKFFIASNGTVWPCCYLWDEYLKNSDFYEQINEDFFDKSWNSFYKHDFNSIFQSDFYETLSHRWEQGTKKFTKRCYLSCGKKGQLRTHFSKW